MNATAGLSLSVVIHEVEKASETSCLRKR